MEPSLAMSSLARFRQLRNRRKFRIGDRSVVYSFDPGDLPEKELPPHRFELRGHPINKVVRSVVVFPGSTKIATGCDDGHVRVFDSRANGYPLVDFAAHTKAGLRDNRMTGLAVLNDHILVSASCDDTKIHTWDARTGECIGTIDQHAEVKALVVVDPETLASGVGQGTLTFIKHTGGRQLTEVARHERAHSQWIVDMACQDDVIVSASVDRNARVWSSSTRKPLADLRGHRGPVRSATVSSQYIVTGSDDKTLRLYANGDGYPLISVLDGLHTAGISTVQFIGSDLVMSASWDRTLCYTTVSPSERPIARQHTNSVGAVHDTAITVDGQIACVKSGGIASIWRVPLAVVYAAREHVITTFGSAGEDLQPTSSWAQVSSSVGSAHQHARDFAFDKKKSYFRRVIQTRGGSTSSPGDTLKIIVRREHVLDDSYEQLGSLSASEFRRRLRVQFSGEEGDDAGGVRREWYAVLARQIFDPNYALFCRSAGKAATYQPNKSSAVNQEHLDIFRFVGRIFGKAICDGQLLDAYFTRAFYKHILGIKPTYHDMEAEDPEYHQSLCWMLNNDITDVLEETFSTEYQEFGQQRIMDLKPSGRHIAVTEQNKEEYVELVTEAKLTRAIEQQIGAFKEGFHELIPLQDCRIFNEAELELLMSGLPDIDVADMKAHAEYRGYTARSPQTSWFWNCVTKMGQEDLTRFVMFVTGTSKVPIEGFVALQGGNGPQRLAIHRVACTTKTRLPTARTCFNRLELPEYQDEETLSDRLLVAIRECSEGFGIDW